MGHSLVTFCWNAVKSVPLSFLPSKSRLCWWLLSVNLCLLVFNSIFRRETKKYNVFRNYIGLNIGQYKTRTTDCRLRTADWVWNTDYNLGQNKWKTYAPPPPNSRMGKWRVFALRTPSSLIWGGWGFAVPFYFVQDCLKASTGVTHSVMIAIMTRNLRSNASKLNAFKANLVICQWTHTKQKNCAYFIYIK